MNSSLSLLTAFQIACLTSLLHEIKKLPDFE